MFHNNKKGFTIVELVIVIAVVAVLAAVLIPTFANLINEANKSADMQAVKQINTYLQINEATDGKPADINEVIAALSENNLSIDHYVPLTKGTFFYWVKSLNKVIHVDADGKIIAPPEYVDATITTEGWYTLSGIASRDDSWTVTDSAVAINDGAMLYDFMTSYNEGKTEATGADTLNLPGSVIDMKGAVSTFGVVSGNLNIKGTDSSTPATLAGFRAADESSVAAVENTDGNGVVDRPYYYGMIGRITSGTYVVIENVTIDGANISFDSSTINGEPSQFALIAGCVDSGATLLLKNVTIKNSSVTGYQKVAALVGQLNGTLICQNVKIENTTVTGFAQTAQIIGHATSSATFEFDTNCDFDVTVKALDPFALDANFDKRATTVTVDGSTYVWSLKNSDDSNIYMYCGGITDGYYWGVTDIETKLNDYFVTDKTVDGKTLCVADKHLEHGTTVIKQGVIQEK